MLALVTWDQVISSLLGALFGGLAMLVPVLLRARGTKQTQDAAKAAAADDLYAQVEARVSAHWADLHERQRQEIVDTRRRVEEIARQCDQEKAGLRQEVAESRGEREEMQRWRARLEGWLEPLLDPLRKKGIVVPKWVFNPTDEGSGEFTPVRPHGPEGSSGPG